MVSLKPVEERLLSLYGLQDVAALRLVWCLIGKLMEAVRRTQPAPLIFFAEIIAAEGDIGAAAVVVVLDDQHLARPGQVDIATVRIGILGANAIRRKDRNAAFKRQSPFEIAHIHRAALDTGRIERTKGRLAPGLERAVFERNFDVRLDTAPFAGKSFGARLKRRRSDRVHRQPAGVHDLGTWLIGANKITEFLAQNNKVAWN